MKIQSQLSSLSYKSSGFVEKYQRLIKDTVIPYQYTVLCDEAEDTEKSHVVKNFINAGKAVRGEDVGDGFYGMVFQDSDAAKWIEAAAYSLSAFPDSDLEETVDKLIEIISEAQDDNGYLNTYFTVKDKEKRWENLLEGHELYCSGHMIEAACAYYEVTGKTKLLDVMKKNVNHIYDEFITKGREGFPGHPEVELALMKMYRLTKYDKALELCKHFINVRGTDPGFYKREVSSRNWTVWGNNADDNNYQQSGIPLREMDTATGHAVRAVYLYTGMADLASEIGDEKLLDACRRLWNSITEKQMYITGGIGSTVHGEAFSVDYDLPPDTAYAETCASIGLMFFASRMLENEVDSRYTDVMEQAFYNTVLAGMQLDGKRFFYVNPLEIIPGISGNAACYRHDLTQRPKWYACACCPPNVARLISSLGKYAYGESEDTAYCHLYAAGEVSFSNGMKLICKTNYPYDFNICYSISGKGRLALRIPHWSKNFTIEVNGVSKFLSPDKGYVYLDIDGDTEIKLVLDGTPRYVYASTKVHRLTGSAALCRGPLVYCFEGVDNDNDVLSVALKEGKIETHDFDSTLLGGTVTMSVDSLRYKQTDSLYTTEKPIPESYTATAIPYYTWGNRGESQMRVWLPCK